MFKKDLYITNAKDETIFLGEKYSSQVKLGEVIFLYGNLGSGKTTFIQGLAKGLGVERRIISPSFIIVRNYNLKKGNFYHIDLYRIQNNLDILGLGIDQILKDKNNIVALEWAEKITNNLPTKRTEIHFKYLDENKREIEIVKYE
ncbi:MAG TPA: tRNA (adenosine(37)-N6)-threonylcarbamoyltransferase complex ATPase subunit type 1 TsaE [Candidatus Sulfotelmatobacter sp.]|nr:tRNA (adenosine(37)-N6)-threonylcarbamoyltransferase complex ATPase subunit type 1 TsaE [Candidatus Sulfotelmatobacter sp.]